MSLINQVLNDLDKRGASTNIGEATIRVVPLRKSYTTFWWIFAVLLLSVLLATAWHKWGNEIQLYFNDAPAISIATSVPASVAESPAQPLASEVSVTETVAASGRLDNLHAASKAAIVVEKPLVMLSPLITEVNPNPAIILGKAQQVTIKGEYFAQDSTLILRTPKRNAYAKRQIVMQNAEQITFTVDFSNRVGSWSVEVVNPSGHSSGQFVFTTQLAAIDAGSKAQPKAAALTESKTIQDTVKPAPLAISKSGVSKRITQITPQQQAENEYRKAYALLQQGQTNAAIGGFEAALQLDAGHIAARQTLVRLLLDNKRPVDAERVLIEGLQHDPKQSSLALLLARIQVGRNELPQALETMEKSLPYAVKQADYQAFVAALLQRQNRHQEAIAYFQHALKLNPQSGVWLMGLGISLRAEQRNGEAREAFNRALEVRNLSAELQSFVAQQLKEL